ncbi:MAG: 30S ribosomal protein S12 methylthiotransferase RimO [Verrucomicrobia bacterium]|nr:30S ribosomal protein S12 methylthiotransferase RimO [Verrucomicrobiota bacterium]
MKKTNDTQRPIRVGLISLGCAKNLVDAELMLGALLKEGVEITNEATTADVVIVNTCSFIDAAQEESVDAILESAALRETHQPHQGLIVSGCLPQRFRDELPKLLPEVDAFMGIDQVAQVPQLVRQALERRRQRIAAESPKAELSVVSGQLSVAKAAAGGSRSTHHALPINHPPLVDVHPRPTFIPDFATPRFRLTPRHFAYVKIAEGCNHPCSFCIIPRMRGSHRSRTQTDILAEAKRLLADGVKELNLISQDTTYYGLDLRPTRNGSLARPEKFRAATKALPIATPTLCTLLRELNALPGEFWIRLLYTHPAHWTDELIETLAACPKVARYVDMPLQHIHENMLQRMRRETSQQYIVDLLARLRARLPGIALRTTFIVGFPGETEACFQTLLDFIRDAQFERLGVFTYSREEATVAGRMSHQIPERVKQRRRDLAMAAQRTVARQVSESFVGRTLKVLVETEATAKELKQARVLSWEHGLIRADDQHTSQLRGRYLVARGEADAPDIDGRVYVRGHLPLGEFARVKIIGHTDYDLIAEPA